MQMFRVFSFLWPGSENESFTAIMTVVDSFKENKPLGNVTMRFYQKWGKIGYARAKELFQIGYFANNAFFRVLRAKGKYPDFMVQWGVIGILAAFRFPALNNVNY